MNAEKIRLAKDKETYLATLYGKALDASAENPILGDTPVLVIAEGVLIYLQENDGMALLRAITRKFPRGQIAFDAYSGAMVRLVSRLAPVRGAKVQFHWGVDDPHDLEAKIPTLHLVDCVEFLAMPELVARLSRTWYYTAIYGTMIRLSFYRTLIRHLLYEFAGS